MIPRQRNQDQARRLKNLKMKFRSRIIAGVACALLVLATPHVKAEDAGDLEARLELAQRMLDVQPVHPQVEAAVDAYVQSNMAAFSKGDQEIFRAAMLNVMNPAALEKTVLNSYADTYTRAELAAMVEYYEKPEARSASLKQQEFVAKIYPEIIKMLDQAVIRIRSTQEP
jgi:hypothetical protein